MAVERIPGAPPVAVERNVPCRARDGVTLSADVYRPEGAGPLPVLLMRDPYDKTGAQGGSGYSHPSWYARHGYVVAVQDCRGRFRSEGDFYPFRHEAEDGYDAVEWAARLPGADGRVAMYGFSYPGAVQLLAASLRPPSLVTIMPGLTSGGFHDGWTYEGGALSLAFVASWAAGLAHDYHRRRGEPAEMAALERAASDPAWYARLPLEDCAPLTRENAPYYFDWLGHPSDDEYWGRLGVDLDSRGIAVPALHLGGWYDVFLTRTVASFAGLERSVGGQKLVIGPWMHGPWVPAWDGIGAEAAATVVDRWQLRWLDRHLKGIESGMLDAPVTVFVLGDGWRDLRAWPPPDARPTDFYLHSAGQAGSAFGDGTLSIEPPMEEPPDVYVYDPLLPQSSRGGHSCCDDGIAPMGPASQHARERWRDVLVYTTAPLPEDLELVGDATVTLHAASSAADTDFTATLCLVDPAGESLNLREGILRCRYRDSLSEPRSLTPGEVYELEIRLGPIGVRVPAGHRLRLDVSSSSFPHWDRNLNTGGEPGREGAERAVAATQTVLHDRAHPSRVTLPVLG